MTSKLFSELGLSPEVLKAIEKMGFEQASPIQAEAIPVLLTGKDIVGQSQTGSGKTAAFAVPAIEKTDPELREVQILILCPTRELAVQVSEEVHKLSYFKRGIRSLPIYGGQSYDRQIYGLRQGAQIIIGTPGRVMDHMRRGTLKLDHVKMVILDEADVMLNMGFREDIEFILQSVPKERQTVFFSATMPKPIRDLIERHSREPQNVRIEQKTMTVSTVDQIYYEVDRRWKVEALTRLIDIHDMKLGIVFCNTKAMVDDLVDHLNAQGYSADRLHGDMSQAMRDRVMNKFRKSGLEFLVATDVAARGIDVDDVEVVINYDLPYDPEDYVHRIGRTGRAGRSGRAISFVAGREMFQIRNIERFTKNRIQRGTVPSLEEVDEARTNVTLVKLRTLLAAGDYKRQDHLIERLLEEGHGSTDIASALLHMMQGGEEKPVKPAKPENAFPREREERPPQGRFDRDDRRPPPRDARAPRSYGRDNFDDRRGGGYGGGYGERPGGYREGGYREPDRGAPIRRDEDWRNRGPAAYRNDARPERPAPRYTDRRDEAPRPERPARLPSSAKQPPLLSSPASELAAPAPREPRAPRDRTVPPLSEQFEQPIDERLLEGHRPVPEKPAAPKASRKTPPGQTRLWMSVGDEMGVTPIDVVNIVSGETGLPGKVVGKVDVRERHLFVDVATEHVPAVVAKLNRAEIKGNKIKIKEA
jgi:ATP-dependent RNA helicase DeaD